MRIGVVTGSGTYALPGFDGEPRDVQTRFGPARVSAGSFAGADVLHVSRHGEGHARLSSAVTHQANISAIKELGADAILAVTVCGATDPSIELGCLIVFDDLHFLVNRLPDGSLCTLHTKPGMAGRGHWIFDGPFAEPLRAALLAAAAETGHAARDGGCYGHVDGPRINTRPGIRVLSNACGTPVPPEARPGAVIAGGGGVAHR